MMYTISKTAEEFSVSERTVRRWITSRQINAIQLNGIYRIPPAEIERISSGGISAAPDINLIRPKKARIKKMGGIRPWEKTV